MGFFYSGVNQLTTAPERELLDQYMGLVRRGGIYPEHLIRQALAKAMQGSYGTQRGIYERTQEELANRGLSRSGLALQLPQQRMQQYLGEQTRNMLNLQLENARSLPQLLQAALGAQSRYGDIWRTAKAQEQAAYLNLLGQALPGLYHLVTGSAGGQEYGVNNFLEDAMKYLPLLMSVL